MAVTGDETESGTVSLTYFFCVLCAKVFFYVGIFMHVLHMLSAMFSKRISKVTPAENNMWYLEREIYCLSNFKNRTFSYREISLNLSYFQITFTSCIVKLKSHTLDSCPSYFNTGKAP